MPDGQPTKLSEAERPVCVLVISPNPKVHGGVSTFVELMKEHLKNCWVTSFWVGSISGEKESASEVILRFFTSPFRVACIVARGKFDVVHINPTFNAKSLPPRRVHSASASAYELPQRPGLFSRLAAQRREPR
jgi:hypothetical protein